MIPISAFDGLVNIIDRLIELLTIHRTRRTEVFKECLKPLFSDLERVHTDYITVFGAALRLVEEDDFFADILTLVRKRRLPLLPVREKLRQCLKELSSSD